MSVHISNYLILCVFISLASGTEPQGYTNGNYGYNGYNNNNNYLNKGILGYNNNNDFNKGILGYNNNNDLNKGILGYNNNNYFTKGIFNLPEFVGNLPKNLMDLLYSLNPIPNFGYPKDNKYLGIQGGNYGQFVKDRGYPGSQRVSTKKPDFSNEPSTTLAPLNIEQMRDLTLLNALLGYGDARERLLATLRKNN